MSSITNKDRLVFARDQEVQHAPDISAQDYNPNAVYYSAQLGGLFRTRTCVHTDFPISENHINFLIKMLLLYLENNTFFKMAEHPWFYSMMEHILSECLHLNILVNAREHDLCCKYNIFLRDLFLKCAKYGYEDELIKSHHSFYTIFCVRHNNTMIYFKSFFEGLKSLMKDNNDGTKRQPIETLRQMEFDGVTFCFV